jgi:hypothetical protein
MGVTCLNQEEALSPFNVTILSQVMAKDCRAVLVKTAMQPDFCEQINELETKKVVRVVVASKSAKAPGAEEPGAKRPGAEAPANDVEYSTVFVPGHLEIIMSSKLTGSPVYFDVSGIDDEEALNGSTLNGSDGPEMPDVGGLLAVRNGVIIGVVAMEFIDMKSMLKCVAFLTPPVLQERCEPGKERFRIVAFYAFSEPLAPPVNGRGIVFVEILYIRLMLTADHEFFRIVFGHQGSAAKLPCWCCTVAKEDLRVFLKKRPMAALRTHAMYLEHAALYPTGISKATSVYKKNSFYSVEFPPLLKLEPRSQTSFGPLHCLLGSTQAAYEGLQAACLLLDGADSAIIEAFKLGSALEARALKSSALFKEANDAHQKARQSLGPQQTQLLKRQQRVTTLSSKTAGKTEKANKKAREDVVAAETLVEESQRTTALSEAEAVRLEDAANEAKAEKIRDGELFGAHEEKERFKLGPLSETLQSSVSKLGVQEQAFFQKLIGNHCETLLKNYEELFDALRKTAATLDAATRSKLESFTRKALVRWGHLAIISSISLKADILSGEEIETFCSSADAYQDLILDEDFFDEEEDEDDDDDDDEAVRDVVAGIKKKIEKGTFEASHVHAYERNGADAKDDRIIRRDALRVHPRPDERHYARLPWDHGPGQADALRAQRPRRPPGCRRPRRQSHHAREARGRAQEHPLVIPLVKIAPNMRERESFLIITTVFGKKAAEADAYLREPAQNELQICICPS